jgi:DNA-directed RNA polymerase alpha subunit
LPPNLQVVSLEKPIATLSRGDARFDAVLTIESGKGYVPSGLQERSKTIGTLPIDAIYSPVTRVNYFVEPTRVGQQTELDRLVIEVSTNGAMTPGNAVGRQRAFSPNTCSCSSKSVVRLWMVWRWTEPLRATTVRATSRSTIWISRFALTTA